MVQKKRRTKSSDGPVEKTGADVGTVADDGTVESIKKSSIAPAPVDEGPSEQPSDRQPGPGEPSFGTDPGKRPSLPDDATPVRRVGRRRAAGPSRPAAAANDDVPSIGGLIYALQQKPSRRPFTVAAVMSFLWLLVGAILVWLTLSSQITAAVPVSVLLANPQTVLLAAAVLLPIVLFWFLALLFWRSQELRLMSSAMTEVAVRLAEPDRLAEQSVASLGQTVRRQVMSMNDAINRSLGRAGELEALVHNEVAALERAYHENEVRVRGLINELVSERKSLTNNSNRVSDTIRGIGLEVTREIAAASDIAAKSLSNATAVLTTEVHKSGSQLTARIQATNDQTAHLMSESGNSLLASLGDMNKRIGIEVPALLDKLSGEQTRLTKIVEGAGRNLAALESALGKRVESLDSSLGEKTELLRDTLQHKIKDFDDTFSDKARTLDAAIGEKMGQFDNAITNKAKMFYQALEKTGVQVDGTIAKGIESVRRSSESITTQSLRTLDGLSQQGDSLRNISEGLLAQIRDLTQRFDQQGQSISRAAHDLETSSFRIDTVLEARHAEMSALLDDVAAQAEAFDSARRGQGDFHRTSGANLRDRYMRASRDISAPVRPAERPGQPHDHRSEIDQMRAQLRRDLEPLPGSDGGASEAMLKGRLQALEALSDYSAEQASRRDMPASRQISGPATARPMITQREQTQPPPGSPPASGGERWSLGDLLSRASGDAPMPFVAEPVGDSAGQDSQNVALDLKNMARAIDMQTATNIWSRLNAGERNTLDRSIYTRDGQVTFDEIGRRFGADAAFRNTVNRYLVDFEQLLREVDQKDPGGNIVRSHLVSEMGRVYLLLAHASGRLV